MSDEEPGALSSVMLDDTAVNIRFASEDHDQRLGGVAVHAMTLAVI
jgi:hypothetical protein